MTPYIAEQITALPQIPASPIAGDGLLPPSEIVDKLADKVRVSEMSRDMINGILSVSGISIEWTCGSDGWVDTELSDQAKEALVSCIESAQLEARDVYVYANEHLLEFKTDVIDGLYAYGRKLGIKDADLKDVLTKSIENISEVKIVAPVAQGDTFEYIRESSGAVAGLERKRGELTVKVASLLEEAKSSGVTMAQQLRTSIIHELIHGVAVGALTPNEFWMIKSGLGVRPTDENGKGLAWTGDTLLDEGSQEQIRWRHIDDGNPSYETGVLFWEMIQALDPTIEKLRFEAKFLNRNRGEMIGRIELILGPSAIEEIEAFEKSHGSLVHFADYKDMLVGMIDIYDIDPAKRISITKAAKVKARKVLDDVQKEIYAPRGRDFTDAELRLAKSRGVTKTSEISSALESM